MFTVLQEYLQICRKIRGLGCVTHTLVCMRDSRNLAHVFSCISVRTFCVDRPCQCTARCIGTFTFLPPTLPLTSSLPNRHYSKGPFRCQKLFICRCLRSEAARKSRGARRCGSASLAEKRYEKRTVDATSCVDLWARNCVHQSPLF